MILIKILFKKKIITMYTFWEFYCLNDINKSRTNNNHIKYDNTIQKDFFNDIIKKINIFTFKIIIKDKNN